MPAVKTPHIELLNENIGFAKTVLMPGDPLRSKYIAENFFENPVLVNNIRGVQGYTGTYKGVKLSVMASGMGMPSIGIYSHELYEFFGVENIIRVGSAGALSRSCGLKDIVAGIGACTNSAYISQLSPAGSAAPVCSYELLSAAKSCADALGTELRIGSLFSTDVFYEDMSATLEWERMGCLAVEMEAAALYANALVSKRRALALCSISDLLYSPGEALSAAEREKGFDSMITLALQTAVSADSLPPPA